MVNLWFTHTHSHKHINLHKHTHLKNIHTDKYTWRHTPTIAMQRNIKEIKVFDIDLKLRIFKVVSPWANNLKAMSRK